MAVIKNQKTGMWEVRTYYKDWTGTRRQKTKRGFTKKSEAQDWERSFKLKDELSINMKFKDFVELYLADIKPRIKYNSSSASNLPLAISFAIRCKSLSSKVAVVFSAKYTFTLKVVCPIFLVKEDIPCSVFTAC